jgi:anti-sigma B factor antagonist
MELALHRRGLATVISFARPIDLEGDESSHFKERIREIISEGASRVVIDLDRVSFIDSSGLGALISGLKMARAAGGDLVLASLSPEIRSVFEITRLLRVFDAHEDAESAVASFEEPVAVMPPIGRS